MFVGEALSYHCYASAAQSTLLGSDEKGQQAKGILKELLSEKFVKYLYFMMDVTKALSISSKTFQSDELCITDVVTSLETTLTLLEELRLEKGLHYKRFTESYAEETAILRCGKNNSQEVQLTRAGTSQSLDSQFDSFLIEVKGYLETRFGNLQEEPFSYFRVFDLREMPQESSSLASHGNIEVKALVQHFANYLTEESRINDWKLVYLSPFKCTKMTKLIIFQYKLLHRRLSTNSFLKKIGIRQSDLSTLCKTEAESLIHLFWSCRATSLFWQEFKQWLTTNHETAINDLSLAIVLGLKPYAFSKKFAITSNLPDTTFGYAKLKRRLLD